MSDSNTSQAPAIDVNNLTYVFSDGTTGIHPTSLQLPRGSRTLLIGANGAGKSTLLRVLAGKTLARQGAVRIYGRDPFRTHGPAAQSDDGIDFALTYLGTEWATNPIVRYDLGVVELLESMGGGSSGAYAQRRQLLVDILDIDLRWRMHRASDGERRRVQLAMGLMRPWTVLLLDEVTVDLDVLVRARLLDFLRAETESRDCAVIYATHIFDGLGEWPTHAVHMHAGAITHFGEYVVELEEKRDGSVSKVSVAGVALDHFETNRIVRHDPAGHSEVVPATTITADDVAGALVIPKNSVLLELALQWLRRDLSERGERSAHLSWAEIRERVLGPEK